MLIKKGEIASSCRKSESTRSFSISFLRPEQAARKREPMRRIKSFQGARNLEEDQRSIAVARHHPVDPVAQIFENVFHRPRRVDDFKAVGLDHLVELGEDRKSVV